MRSERPGSTPQAPVQPARPRQAFTKALARAKPSLAGTATLASRSAGHAITAQALQRARASHAVEARRLVETRKDHPAAPSPAFPRGARERVMEALESAPPPSPQAPPGEVPTRSSPNQADPAPTSRVESALRLVERMEVFLRSGRPQLELSVGGQLQAQVLLERTGPREVAVTVRGRNGPPPAQELARVREEMQRRGLKVSSLAIG